MNFSNKSGGNNLKTENKMKKTSQTTLSLDHERSRAVSEKIKIMNALCTRSRSIVTEEKIIISESEHHFVSSLISNSSRV